MVCVAQCLVFCVMFCRSLFVFSVVCVTQCLPFCVVLRGVRLVRIVSSGNVILLGIRVERGY